MKQMMSSPEVQSRKRKLKGLLGIISWGTLFGVLYPLLSRELDDPIALINGATVGALGSFLIGVWEIFGNRPEKSSLSFRGQVLISSTVYALAYICLILTVIAISRGMASEVGFVEYLTGPEMKRFILDEDFIIILFYTLLLTGSITFVTRMSRRLGGRVLWSIVSGKYHRPVQEERIFMFMDLKGSTSIAEKLGDLNFHRMLRDVFSDVSSAILNYDGIIYRYVGDEMVSTWSLGDETLNVNPIMAAFEAKELVHARRHYYHEQYGMVPEFTVGIDTGTVLAGEVGDVKSQVVYYGEVMYKGAALQKQCKKVGEYLLISSELKEKIALPSIFVSKEIESLNAFNVREKD